MKLTASHTSETFPLRNITLADLLKVFRDFTNVLEEAAALYPEAVADFKFCYELEEPLPEEKSSFHGHGLCESKEIKEKFSCDVTKRFHHDLHHLEGVTAEFRAKGWMRGFLRFFAIVEGEIRPEEAEIQ